MIEVIVVMAIFSALVGMSAFFDLTFYRGSSFNSDYDVFIAVLQRSRARAVNNINGSKHGLYIDSDKYILFQGDDYATATAAEEISRNPDISYTGAVEVVFNQLSGDSSFGGKIVLSDGFKTATVSFNNEGQIDW